MEKARHLQASGAVGGIVFGTLTLEVLVMTIDALRHFQTG